MNPAGFAQAVVHVVPDVLAENRFRAARNTIERQPCLKPLSPVVWATRETLEPDPRWQNMGNGVVWL